MAKAKDHPGRRHPLYRAIRASWWVIAIWVAGAVLIGVIRGTFVTGPVPPDVDKAPAKATTTTGVPQKR